MLVLKKIYKDYYVDKKAFRALTDINLNFREKGFVSILGPSGCGKTTLLNLIGGLDHYTEGDLIIDGKSTKEFTDRDWDAYRNRRIGFVFQSYNLVPHLTVLNNVEMSMTLSGLRKKERVTRALEALDKVGLKDIAKKLPNQLSGGQMQRVAIARALVNNPEIILADEPTGALDSVTSVQVMKVLKEVSKGRLVIMVTHNIEIANKYSTRIIRLRDGKVVSDSKPYRPKKEKTEIIEDANANKDKHTHMNFRTALSSSFKNLLTKKGRTALTALAASFGIIGVALVLALSNGFNNYVHNVEMSTASTVPITIAPFVTTSIQETTTPEEYPSDPVIKPFDQDISKLVTIHRNKITQEYADYCKQLLEKPQQYASSVLDNHEYLDFNIFTKRKTVGGGEEIIKINQFSSAGAAGSILSGVTNLPSTIFHELYGGPEYINSMYDVVSGHYPTNDLVEQPDGTYVGEVCLVCDRYNRIPMSTLYDLGLSSQKTTTSADQTISFDDLLNHEYKAFMPDVVMEAVKLDATSPRITTTILKEKYVVFDKNDYRHLKPATEDKTITVFRDVSAREGNNPKYPNDLNNLFNNDSINKPVKLKISGIIRPKKETLINLMPGSVCYTESLKQLYVNNMYRFEEYGKIARNNYYIDPICAQQIVPGVDVSLWDTDFLAPLFQSVVSGNTNTLNERLNNLSYIAFYNILTDQDVILPHVSNQYSTHYLRSNYRFANEFKTPIFTDYQEIQGYKVPTNFDPNSIDDVMDLFNYVNGYSTITSVLVFPKTLSDKQRIFTYLDEWNKGKEDLNQVKYSDIAGTLTDALGTMIDIISVVLICFSALSLIVSCVMTGIITYTSVLERTKEIGVLRAIGARKKDVGRLFEAESVIVGTFGGLIGVIFTFIVEIPISLIISHMFPAQHIGMICNLNPWHAVVLILVSALLTFIAGFIPARKASKKDPVVALRSE